MHAAGMLPHPEAPRRQHHGRHRAYDSRYHACIAWSDEHLTYCDGCSDPSGSDCPRRFVIQRHVDFSWRVSHLCKHHRQHRNKRGRTDRVGATATIRSATIRQSASVQRSTDRAKHTAAGWTRRHPTRCQCRRGGGRWWQHWNRSGSCSWWYCGSGKLWHLVPVRLVQTARSTGGHHCQSGRGVVTTRDIIGRI